MKYLITFFILLFISSLQAQTKAVTFEGDTILIHENGTWSKILKSNNIDTKNLNVIAEVKVDDFTNKKTIVTKSWDKIGNSNLKRKLTASMKYYNEGIYGLSVFFPVDLGCMSSHSSKLQVKLVNGDVVEFSYVSKTDCGDYVTGTFVPLTDEEIRMPNAKETLKSNIDKLATYDWESIRITGSEYYSTIKPNKTKKITNPEQFFRNHILAIRSKL